MGTREYVKQELSETAAMLLDAMAAERRMFDLSPSAAPKEAAQVLVEADALRAQALHRFRLMCAHLACAAKGPAETDRASLLTSLKK